MVGNYVEDCCLFGWCGFVLFWCCCVCGVECFVDVGCVGVWYFVEWLVGYWCWVFEVVFMDWCDLLVFDEVLVLGFIGY